MQHSDLKDKLFLLRFAGLFSKGDCVDGGIYDATGRLAALGLFIHADDHAILAMHLPPNIMKISPGHINSVLDLNNTLRHVAPPDTLLQLQQQQHQ